MVEGRAAGRQVHCSKAQAAEGEQARRASLAVVEREPRLRDSQVLAAGRDVRTPHGVLPLRNLQTHATWWIWAALGMGLSLSMQATRIFFGEVRDVREQGLSRRERRRRRRQERLGEFQARVEIGADAILKVVDEARKVKAQGATRAAGGRALWTRRCASSRAIRAIDVTRTSRRAGTRPRRSGDARGADRLRSSLPHLVVPSQWCEESLATRGFLVAQFLGMTALGISRALAARPPRAPRPVRGSAGLARAERRSRERRATRRRPQGCPPSTRDQPARP